jgi:hypothetical protein
MGACACCCETEHCKRRRAGMELAAAQAVCARERPMGLRDWLSRNEDQPARMRDIYLRASEAFDAFIKSQGQDGPALRSAGQILCDGLGALGDNRAFWDALTEDAQADPQRVVSSDMGRFIEEHADKLDTLLNKPGATERIVSDIAGLSKATRMMPVGADVRATLRGHIASFAQQLCEAVKTLDNTAKSRRRLIGFVRRGLIIVVGVLVVIAGVLATPTVGPIVSAIIVDVGVGVIVSQIVPD